MRSAEEALLDLLQGEIGSIVFSVAMDIFTAADSLMIIFALYGSIPGEPDEQGDQQSGRREVGLVPGFISDL